MINYAVGVDDGQERRSGTPNSTIDAAAKANILPITDQGDSSAKLELDLRRLPTRLAVVDQNDLPHCWISQK